MSDGYKKRGRKPIYDALLGEPPTAEQIQKMEKQARNVVFYWLESSERTRHFLRQKLEKKQHTPEVIEKILDEMEELNYLSDRRYAEMFVEDALRFQKLGAFGIKRKLREKGVPQDIIESVVEEETQDHDFEDSALELARQRMKPTRNYEPQKRLTNIASFLVRRGYSGGVAFAAAKSAIAEEVEAQEALEDLHYDGD